MSTPKTIVGIDYSMTTPCICVYSSKNDEFTFDNCDVFYYTKVTSLGTKFRKNISGNLAKPYKNDMERYLNLSSWVIDILKNYENIHVCLEGYSMGSKGKVFNIAENTGVLKLSLHLAAIPVLVIAPTTIKKFASGKGNADKLKMHESFIEETGIDLKMLISPNKKEIGNPVSDIVDAYFLCKYGLENIS